VVPDERTPRLRAHPPTRRSPRHVLSDRSGEMRIPSLTRSSAAIRSSPHVRFAVAMVAIS
jgi:hypothetical protein